MPATCFSRAAPPTTRVGEVMETEVVFARPDWTVEDCTALVSSYRERHLPVIESDQLVGIISIGDLVTSVIADQRDTFTFLEDYITDALR